MKCALSLHFFACGWMLLYKYHSEGDDSIDFGSDQFGSFYVESLYAMSTTISTVGYGDISGYQSNEGKWALEMSYLIIIMSLGIIMFSYIVNEILSYRRLETVQKMVKDSVYSIKIYLNEISEQIEN